MLNHPHASFPAGQTAASPSRRAGGLFRSRTGILITVGFGLTLCLFGAVLAYGLVQVNQIHGSVHTVVGTNNSKEYLIREMHNAARERLLNSFRMFNSDDPFIRDELYQVMQAKGTQYLAARERLLAMPLSPHEKQMLRELDTAASISAPLLRRAVELLLAGDTEAARDLVAGAAIPAQDRLLRALNELSEHQRSQAEWTVAETDQQHGRALELMSSLGVLSIALGLAIAILVTRRIMRAEGDLFRQKERAEVTLRSIGDGVLTLDAQGRVTYINPSAARLLQTYSRGAQGRTLAQLASFFSADTGAPVHDPLQQAQAAREGGGRESVLARLDRGIEQTWVQNYAARLHDASGAEAGSVFVIRDVTETITNQHRLTELNASLESRVEERTRALALANSELQGTIDTLQQTQSQLIQSEKMAALGSLVAGISHEVNTPIGIAVTAGSNIAEKVQALQTRFQQGGLTKGQMQELLDHIAEGSRIMLVNLNRASQLISSFKQVAVDQSSDQCRQIDLHRYCDEIITSLHPKLKRRPIEVINDCAENTLIHTRPGALYQIISNLIINALVHAYPDQQTPGQIRIGARREGSHIIVEFSDDGQGISPEHLPRVFEPFFTTRRGRGGSGLGLNIVYNLVTAKLGGEITVRNREQGGTCFFMTFPELTQELCDERTG